MSAFLGGFAETLLQERQANDAVKRETDAYKKKQQILLDMQRNEKPDYQAKVWRILDGNGNEVATRPMTPSEIEDRDLGVRKTKADVSSAESGAKGAELDLGIKTKYGDEKARLGLDADREQIATSRHTRANQDARLGLDYRQDARAAETHKASLGDLGKMTKKANPADLYELTSSSLDDILSTNGRLAASELNAAIQRTVATNPNLTNRQAASIVINAMRSRFGSATATAKAELQAASRASGAADTMTPVAPIQRKP